MTDMTEKQTTLMGFPVVEVDNLPPRVPETYTCAACGGVFEKTRPEEEVEAEYKTLFPDEAASGAPRDVVCDDCFNAMDEEFGFQ